MKPQPVLTVLFVKRFLALFTGGLILFFLFPDYSEMIWGVILIGGTLIWWFLQGNFPKTRITVDEETISLRRTFPGWHPLRKYYLHELIIPHPDWNKWVKVRLSDEEGDIQNFYLFFLDERLRFSVKSQENGDLEYWVQQKFPDKPLEMAFSFKKYRERYDHLKEKDRMKVF